MEKISPRVDIAFKKIFGVEENKDLLISLINSVVDEEDQVCDLTLLNPYNPKNFRNDKLSILDIKAQGHDGKRFNIEIQITDERDYDKRALYYWAKLYIEQLKASQSFSTLTKAIGIHILNFTSIPQATSYHNVFHVRERKSHFLYFKNLELHTIELKKFSGTNQENLMDLVAKIQTSLDMWVAFLTRHDLLEKEPLPPPLNDPSLKKALHVLDVMNFGPEEREMYEGQLKWFLIEMNTLQKAEEKGHQKGHKEGHKVGFQEGKEIGIQEGKEIGIQEGKELGFREVAKKLLQQGFSVEEIANILGVPEEDITLYCLADIISKN